MPREPEQFYPGTTRPVRSEAPPPDERDDADQDWPYKGKDYPVHGRLVTFYTIGVLAEALGMSVPTVYKWERKGWLPKTKFRGPVQGMGGRRRLYTREQIETIVRIADEEGLLANPNKPKAETRFTERVRQAMAQLDPT